MATSIKFIETERWPNEQPTSLVLTPATLGTATEGNAGGESHFSLEVVNDRPEDELMSLFEERLVATGPEAARATIQAILTAPVNDHGSDEK